MEDDIQNERGEVFSDVSGYFGQTVGEFLDNALSGCMAQKLVGIAITTRDHGVQEPSSDILLKYYRDFLSNSVHLASYTPTPYTLKLTPEALPETKPYTLHPV